MYERVTHGKKVAFQSRAAAVPRTFHNGHQQLVGWKKKEKGENWDPTDVAYWVKVGIESTHGLRKKKGKVAIC